MIPPLSFGLSRLSFGQSWLREHEQVTTIVTAGTMNLTMMAEGSRRQDVLDAWVP